MWRRLQNLSRGSIALIAVIPAFVIFIAIMLIISLVFDNARIDLTERQVYTLSESTLEVLDSVEEPITLRFFMSSELAQAVPDVRTHGDRVLELLRSYERRSNGLVRFEQIDPIPFSPEEDTAISYGLVSFNLSRAGEQGYFGLVGTNSLDQIEVIDVLVPSQEAFLEYELTRMVLRLSRPTEPKVAVMDGLQQFGSAALGRQPSYLIERLGDDFALTQLGQDITAIPDDIDALFIIHPHSVSESALYAIDQYAIRGGPVLVALDSAAFHTSPSPTNPAVPEFPDSYLEPVMRAWGVEMLPEKVVGDRDMAIEIRGQGGNNQIVIADYPPWLIVDDDNINRDDIITAQLTLMRIQTAGALMPVDGAQTTLTPLIYTTGDSMLYDQAVILRRDDPNTLLNMFQPSGTPFTLAARVNGPVTTAFPDGAPPAPEPSEGEDAPTPAPELVTEGEINVVVLTDTDMLTDELTIDSSGSQNADFIVNALDNLIGGDQLIGLRGRGQVFRPFTRVDEVEAEAEARYRQTERDLQAELDEVEAQIEEIRSQSLAPDGQLGALTRSQRELVDDYNQQVVELRLQLRDVRSELRSEIDTLTTQVRLINIFAVPAIVIIIGLIVWIWRRVRLANYLRGSKAAG